MVIISQKAVKYILLSCQAEISGKTYEVLTTFYAKQSQFLKRPNERKPLWKKGLRKRTAPGALQKQTQSFDPAQDGTKPISDYPCVFELAVYNLVLHNGNVMHGMPNGRNFDGEYMKWQMHRKPMR